MSTPRSRFPAYPPNLDPGLQVFLEAIRSEIERAFTETLNLSGNLEVTGQIITHVTTGTPPLVVSSTTKVLNLNADLLDDQHGAYYLDLANATGVLTVAKGGTGAASLPTNALLVGAGTSPVTALSPGAAGQVVRSTGTAWASAQLAFADIGGVATKAQLPAAVAYEDEANTFTMTQNFSASVIVGTDPGGTELVRAASGRFTTLVGSIINISPRSTGNYLQLATYGRWFESDQALGAAGAGDTFFTFNAKYSSGWKSIASGRALAFTTRAGDAFSWFASQNTGAPDTVLTWTENLLLKGTGELDVLIGPLIVGTDPGGTALLRVGGGVATSGNVGIGTTNPLRTLEVNNAMRFTNSSADTNDGVIGTAPFGAGLNIVGINTDGGGRKISYWGSLIQNENPVGNTFIGNTYFTGPLVVGTDPGGTGLLRVGGITRAGSRIGFNSTNDGRTSGVWLWNADDSNHAMYLASPAGFSPAGTAPVSGFWNTLDSFRFRCRTHYPQGFAWENSNDVLLADLAADTGNFWLKGDLQINALGRFDSTDIPTDSQLLVYHAGSINKWQAESVQFIYNAGDAAVGLLPDNTAVQYLLNDPGTGADSPAGAPPVPVLKLFPFHKGVTVAAYASTNPDVAYHDGPSFPADFRYFIYEYSTDNFATVVRTLATASSDKVNHGRLTPGQTYYYRVRAVDRFGNASANSAVVSFVAVADSSTSNFGVVLAEEIAVDRLAALSANVGIITAGQLRNSGNTAGFNLGAVGGIPASWTMGINVESGVSMNAMTRYLNLAATGTGAFLKHERLELNVDGSVRMYGASGNALFSLDATTFLLQNDAATPTQGLLVMGSAPPANWTRYLNLNGSGAMLKHDKLTLNYDGTAFFNGQVSLDLGAGGRMEFVDPGVTHGMTDIAPTNVYGTFAEFNAAVGSFSVRGFADSSTYTALFLEGYSQNPTGGAPPVEVVGHKKSGTGTIALSDTEPLFWINNNDITTPKWAVMGGGQVQMVNGTASVPALSFLSDTNTGLTLSAPDTLSLVTSGAIALQALPNGSVNVQIGGAVNSTGRVVTRVGSVFNLATASSVEVSLGTITLPANALFTNGDTLLIHAVGQIPNATGTFTIKINFGATNVATATLTNPGVTAIVTMDVQITRIGPTAQLGASRVVMSAQATNVTNATIRQTRLLPTETLSGAITIDFRVQSNGVAAVTLDSAVVTLVAQ